FRRVSQSFVDVPITADGIDTVAFLLALESLLKFFELFAPAAAGLASGDIIEDIRRIRTHYLSAPTECRTLELLVKHEQPQRRKLATQSLMWCFRGLKFTALACRFNLDNPTEELSESFARSWDAEYSSYFSWVVRPLFKLLVKACPPRAQFYEKLGSPKQKVERDLSAYLTSIDSQVGMLERFYKEGKQ
ncbi:glycolipid transfer protein domain-containing protein, partial [Leucosporidium creatinivorum]